MPRSALGPAQLPLDAARMSFVCSPTQDYMPVVLAALLIIYISPGLIFSRTAGLCDVRIKKGLRKSKFFFRPFVNSV